MAALDPTLPLSNPLLTDAFNVIRRQETVGVNGRSGVALQTFAGVTGVVNFGGDNSLERGAEYDVFARALSIVTRFHLIGEVVGYKPDIVFWRGSHYLVRNIESYAHFGSGFYQVECESVERVDPDILSALGSSDGGGSLVFNRPASSGYLALGF